MSASEKRGKGQYASMEAHMVHKVSERERGRGVGGDGRGQRGMEAHLAHNVSKRTMWVSAQCE